MNLRQLNTLAAFLRTGSFSATGDSLGLSHSAISVQMTQLEVELGAELFDRSTRPPTLTALGEQIAAQARSVVHLIETIRTTAAGRNVSGRIAIGFVPTTLHTVLPALLNKLRFEYPELEVVVESGLSSELAALVTRRELDFAILTSPTSIMPDLATTEIGAEPLFAIAAVDQRGAASDIALVQSMPFISFSKKSWLGQQIAARLQSRGIVVNQIMEVDSFDAIEKLVMDGFGVSIVPQRLLAPRLSEQLVRIPFCSPPEARKLVMIQPADGRNAELARTIKSFFSDISTHPE